MVYCRYIDYIYIPRFSQLYYHKPGHKKHIRPILTTHIFFPLFFFLSLILPFSCLRFFSDLTANVTFFNFL